MRLIMDGRGREECDEAADRFPRETEGWNQSWRVHVFR